MDQAINKEPMTVIEPSHIRDFTYIDDVVMACIAASQLKGFNVFNVASGTPTSISALVQLIQGIFDYKIEVTRIPERGIDNLTNRSISIKKIRPIWVPVYTLYEGLSKLKPQLIQNSSANS